MNPYSYEDDSDVPVDSTKDWQCTVLSIAAHVLLLFVAVFCMPVSALYRNDLPKEEIIMVTMENLPIECSTGSASEAGAQSNVTVAAPQADLPIPPPELKPVGNFKSVKRTVATVKPKPVSIKPPEPETAPQNQPEPALSLKSMTQTAIVPENPQIETGIASSDAETSGSGIGSPEKGKHSGGGAMSMNGQGLNSGTGSGSGEIAFGLAGGPGFIHRALPSFPRRAQAQGKEGTVVLRLVIDHTGLLSHVEVISGAGNGFDEEAVRAIQKSTFSPAVRNGRPVTCLALLSVRFQLESKE